MIRALGANKHVNAACGSEQVSARTCIATRVLRPPEDLVRFVAGPDGQVIPDIARKLPGRGVWVTCHKDSVTEAIASRAFPRTLRVKVKVSEDLPDLVNALLTKRALELLSICNKAGLVATGSGKVNSWLESGANGALVQAMDASPDGLEKVARKYRAIRAAAERRSIEVSLLTINDLSLAMGRENVVHAVLSEGKAATNFLAAVSRVQKYRAAQFEAPALKVAQKTVEQQSSANQNTGQA